jgi:hypothetical protein
MQDNEKLLSSLTNLLADNSISGEPTDVQYITYENTADPSVDAGGCLYFKIGADTFKVEVSNGEPTGDIFKVGQMQELSSGDEVTDTDDVEGDDESEDDEIELAEGDDKLGGIEQEIADLEKELGDDESDTPDEDTEKSDPTQMLTEMKAMLEECKSMYSELKSMHNGMGTVKSDDTGDVSSDIEMSVDKDTENQKSETSKEETIEKSIYIFDEDLTSGFDKL